MTKRCPAYNIVNTRIGSLNGRWDIAFSIDNLTDEWAFLALDQERGTLARLGYLTNPPRSFGVSTRIEFTGDVACSDRTGPSTSAC